MKWLMKYNCNNKELSFEIKRKIVGNYFYSKNILRKN